MRLRRKVKNVTIVPVNTSPLMPVGKFLDQCREMKDNSSRYGVYLVGVYREVFGTEPPNAMLALIKSKIAYKLDYVGKKTAGAELSAHFLRNYEASQKLDLEKFDTDSRFFLESDIKRELEKNGGVSVMAKVKKKVAKVEKKVEEQKEKDKSGLTRKVSVRRTFVECFTKNPKTTNEEVLAVIKKAHPEKKKYTISNVQSFRSWFNASNK